MSFRLDVAWEVLPALLVAFGVTLHATLLGFALAATLGLVWAVLRLAAPRAVATGVALWVEFLRSTPLLVQLYFLFYVSPHYGLELGPLATGTLALGLHFSAYTSEVYRAGLEGVPRGQWDAARALGLSPWQQLRDVVVPQALPPVAPALGNYLVAMFKETPLLSAITVVEVLQRAKLIGAERFRYLEPVTLVGFLFLAASLASMAGLRALERRLGRWRA